MTHKEQHGKYYTPEYVAWCNMKTRCYYSKHPQYKDWGGRGITVCDRWLNSFLNFFEDMGEKPTPTHSLDRIDVDGNYSPENCRWATRQEQSANRRERSKNKNNSSGFRGVTKARDKWRARYISGGKSTHLGLYDDPQKANKIVEAYRLEVARG